MRTEVVNKVVNVALPLRSLALVNDDKRYSALDSSHEVGTLNFLNKKATSQNTIRIYYLMIP